MAGWGNSTTQAHSRLMSEELIEQMYSDFLNVWIQFVLSGLITVLQSLTCLHLVSYVTKAQSCSYHLTTDEPPLASRLWVSLWLFFPCIMQRVCTRQQQLAVWGQLKPCDGGEAAQHSWTRTEMACFLGLTAEEFLLWKTETSLSWPVVFHSDTSSISN